MPNVHTPERQPDETQSEYRERQARSRAIHRSLVDPKPQTYGRQPLRKADAARRDRRSIVQRLGRRQALKQIKAARRIAKAA